MAKKLTVDNCPLIPMEDQMLVRKIPADKTAGGILLPGQEKGRVAVRGEVVKTGQGRYFEMTGQLKPMTVKEGDVILYLPHATTELGEGFKLTLAEQGIESEEIELLAERNVLAIQKK